MSLGVLSPRWAVSGLPCVVCSISIPVPISSEQYDILGHYLGDISLHTVVVVIGPGLYTSLDVQFRPFVKYAARFSLFQSTM